MARQIFGKVTIPLKEEMQVPDPQPEERCQRCKGESRRRGIGCNRCGGTGIEPAQPEERQRGHIPKQLSREERRAEWERRHMSDDELKIEALEQEVKRLREALDLIHSETDHPTTNPRPLATIREIARAALQPESND